jgi:pilus assembly protein CpaE
MKTQGIVVADDPVYLSWLQNAVGAGAEFSLARPLDAEDLLERMTNVGRVDLVLFEFDAANAASRATLIERLLERYPECPVIGLGADGSPEIVLAAMRAGARDFFVLRRDDENLPALLSKVLRRSVPGGRASSQKQGRIFTVFAATPYEGVPFLAEHLALSMLSRIGKGERGIIVDMSAPAGSAAVFLNINPSYSVLDAIHDVYRCDQTLVDTAFARHGSGLYVLSLPEDLIGRPEFNNDEFIKLLEVFRTLFSFTVVSLDAHLPLQTVVGAITQAERSLLVTDQSILKSRHSKYLLRALRLEDCPLDRTHLVVDHYQRRLGLEAENLAELLDLPLIATLTGQAVNRAQAKNSGEPMSTLAPKDPYCREVEMLAEGLFTGQLERVEVERTLFDRVFG